MVLIVGLAQKRTMMKLVAPLQLRFSGWVSFTFVFLMV